MTRNDDFAKNRITLWFTRAGIQFPQIPARRDGNQQCLALADLS